MMRRIISVDGLHAFDLNQWITTLTGGTPKTTGVFHDHSYSRNFFRAWQNL
jgi:hypothetical protein